MILLNADMWSIDTNLRIVTTNSYINQRGELVMGRGAALQAKEKYSTLPKVAAETIAHLSRYGLRVLPQFNIGLFQVKYNWADDANLDLIQYSTNMLTLFARVWCDTIVLNYPGIGNGRLQEKDVYSIIKDLPDNVMVCKL